MLQKQRISHYDGKKNGWNWGKFVSFHKEQNAIMKSLTDYGCSGLDNSIKVRHFLQGIKSTELKAAVNVVLAQQERYGTDFDAKMSYLGQIITKKRPSMQSVQNAKTRSQPVQMQV